MKLNIYNTQNCQHLPRNGNPTIRFRREGSISITRKAAYLLSLKSLDYISFAQDNDKPADWYLIKSGKEGFLIRGTKQHRGLVCNCAAITGKIFKCFNDKVHINQKSIGFRISGEPVKIDGQECYAIITANILK